MHKINCDGYSLSFNSGTVAPVLSPTAKRTLKRLQIPLPPPITKNLNHKIKRLSDKPLSFVEPGGGRYSNCSSLGKFLITVTLEIVLITCILTILAFPGSAAVGGLGAIALFAGAGLLVSSMGWAGDARTEMDRGNREGQGIALSECHNGLLSFLFLWVLYLIPFTALIEPFFHNYRYEKIHRLQKESIARDFISLFKYYEKNFSDNVQCDNKTYKEMQAAHAFYMRMFRPTIHQTIIENCDSVGLPKELGQMIAEKCL